MLTSTTKHTPAAVPPTVTGTTIKKVIALVGASNAGKTSALKMLISSLAVSFKLQLIINPIVPNGSKKKPVVDMLEYFNEVKIESNKEIISVGTSGDTPNNIDNNFEFAIRVKATILITAVSDTTPSGPHSPAYIELMHQCRTIGVTPDLLNIPTGIPHDPNRNKILRELDCVKDIINKI